MHKSSNIASEVPQKIAASAHAPVEIGTTGTVASLIMKEMEYFSQLELRCQEGSKKPQTHVKDMASLNNSHSRPPTVTSVITTEKKKKRRLCNMLPSICSKVAVSDKIRQIGMISRFHYRNLKSDMKKLHIQAS